VKVIVYSENWTLILSATQKFLQSVLYLSELFFMVACGLN